MNEIHGHVAHAMQNELRDNAGRPEHLHRRELMRSRRRARRRKSFEG
jgi:hypothetical protein